MKAIVKILGIIATAILSIVSLSRLVPTESVLGTLLEAGFVWLNQNTFWGNFAASLLAALGIAVFISLLTDLKSLRKKHVFKVNSKSFTRFFENWYSKEGPLSIFCDDLEGWVGTAEDAPIYKVLLEKSRKKELHLFLNRPSPRETVRKLKDAGAYVHRAPANVVANYSFSCFSVMGNNSAVIVRNKQLDNHNKIVFEEVSDSYISGLLNALIKGAENG